MPPDFNTRARLSLPVTRWMAAGGGAKMAEVSDGKCGSGDAASDDDGDDKGRGRGHNATANWQCTALAMALLLLLLLPVPGPISSGGGSLISVAEVTRRISMATSPPFFFQRKKYSKE